MCLHEFVETRPAGTREVMARLEEPQDELFLVSKVSALKESSELPLRFSLPAEGGVALLSHHAECGAAVFVAEAQIAEVRIFSLKTIYPRHFVIDCCRGLTGKFEREICSDFFFLSSLSSLDES